MEWPQIEALVEKYWEGETSLAEEATLREALTRSDVPAALRREAELMGFWQAERQRTLSPTRDHVVQRVHLTRSQEEPTPAKARSVTFSPLWVRIAATVVIAAGLFLFNLRSSNPTDPLGALLSLQEEVTPEETYNEVRDALLFISLKFQQGAEPMENLQEIHHAQQPLEQLKNFNRAEEIIQDNNE